MKRGLPAYVYAKGRKGYLYFVRGGFCQRMKYQPGTADFAAEYALLMRGNVVAPVKTIAKMIEAFRKSPEWAKLAANTRKSYTRHFDYFAEKIGAYAPDKMTILHVNTMRDALAEKPTDANRKVATLSSLYTWGKANGWTTTNPAISATKLEPTGRDRHPWPQDLIDAARATAKGRDLLLFEMLLGTGQRVNDVLFMRWSDMDKDGITITPAKTKGKKPYPIYIPLTSRLRSVLAEAPRKGLFIIAQDNGLRVSYPLAWKNMMDLRKAIGAEAYDIHALRHSAASEIAALPGMTADHVRSITGHSGAAMVRLYAGAAMQKARAKEAQEARNVTGSKGEN